MASALESRSCYIRRRNVRPKPFLLPVLRRGGLLALPEALLGRFQDAVLPFIGSPIALRFHLPLALWSRPG